MSAYKTGIDRDRALMAQLDNERSSFITHWREIGDMFCPRRMSLDKMDRNRGSKRNDKIIDSTPVHALNTLRSGMMAGVTSPARPWFRLTTPDPDLAEFGSVKEYLDRVTRVLSARYLRSNLYNILPIIYGDMGSFATACFGVDEDLQSFMRCYPFQIGTYYISNNAKGRVDVFVREFPMTTRQIVEKFGRDKKDPANKSKIDWTNISEQVKTAWDQGSYEHWFNIVHIVQPNHEHDTSRFAISKNLAFSSCYYEQGSGSTTANYRNSDLEKKYLLEEGYDYFPIITPRWMVNGQDAYGTSSPAMDALGDARQLQIGERKELKAIDKMIDPPLIGNALLKTSKVSQLPGDVTWFSGQDMQQGLRPIHEVNLNVQQLEFKQEQVRNRINKAFFVDIFLMLSNTDRRQITAREIDAREAEKLIALGPVLEGLNQDLLDPIIDIGYRFGINQNLFGEAPEELHGVDLKVEYESIMAQAQKVYGSSSYSNFMNFYQQALQLDPNVKHKVNMNNLVDLYGETLSMSPKVIRTEDAANALAGAEIAQLQKQNAMAMIAQGAQTAKTMAETPTDGENALTQLKNQASAGQLVGL